MAKLKIASATIDGEAVIWGPNGVDFDKLHGRARVAGSSSLLRRERRG
jgi:ATP-dependent DNA ligase